jgi:hypothetical protein
MEQIADVLNTVPAASPFWISMRDSLLQIDVKGWRIVYRIDQGHREIAVVEIARVRG